MSKGVTAAEKAFVFNTQKIICNRGDRTLTNDCAGTEYNQAVEFQILSPSNEFASYGRSTPTVCPLTRARPVHSSVRGGQFTVYGQTNPQLVSPQVPLPPFSPSSR